MDESHLEPNRSAIRELQQHASDVFESLDEHELRAVDGGEETLAHAASWCRYVQHAIAAVRLLHDSGLGNYAAPIRRSIIEHALAVASVALNPDAFASYLRTAHYKASHVRDAIDEADLPRVESLEDFLSWEPGDHGKTHDSKVNVRHCSDQLGRSGKRLYVAWLQETQLSHASAATATLYLRSTDGDAWPTLTHDPQVQSSGWEADALCADALILSLDGLSQLLTGDPLRADIQELNAAKFELLTEAAALSGQEPPWQTRTAD